MMKMMALVPQPNQSGDNANYFNTGTQRLNRNNIDAKINWNRNERQQLWFKYSMMDALVQGDFSLGAAGGNCLCAGGGLGKGSTLVQIGGMGTTYTVSPTFLIDGVLGWTRFGQDVAPPDLGTNFGLDTLGTPRNERTGPKGERCRPMYISGFSALGNPEGWNPLYRNDQSYTFNTNATKIKGTHDIRFGFDFVHHLMNHWQPELGEGPRGAFYFDPGVTALNPDALRAAGGFTGGTPSFENDWNALAAFEVGTPDVSGKSTQFIKMDSLENQYALYIRDRWRTTPKLTVDLGLRWELYPNRSRSGGLGIESYDPNTNEALIGGRGGIPQDNGVGYSKKLFAPRVGFAYQIGDATVVRSGYGITLHSHRGRRHLRLVTGRWWQFSRERLINRSRRIPRIAAGVPNAPLGPNVGFLDLPRTSAPEDPLSRSQGIPRANEMPHRGCTSRKPGTRKPPAQMVATLVRGLPSVGSFLDINASQIPDRERRTTAFAKLGDLQRVGRPNTQQLIFAQATLNRRFAGPVDQERLHSKAIDEATT
jgi:hypothetical protein